MIRIYLGDLSHKHQKWVAFPYNVGLVASYALKEFGAGVSVELFKDTEALRDRVKAERPDIVGLSNFMWNSILSIRVLEQIKKEYPDVVTLLGGCNYNSDEARQKDFLNNNSHIDFYVVNEGETGFVNLVKKLINFNMDLKGLKEEMPEIPGVHYLSLRGMMRSAPAPRIENLDDIPSPYLTGLLDPFFDEDLSLVMQRTRGCPFTCTFCNEGIMSAGKVTKFSVSRIVDEFRYCAARLAGKSGRRGMLHITDANFGMFPEDFEVASEIARIRREADWPLKIETPTGKNRKGEVIRAINKLNEGPFPVAQLVASVQSTDPVVLKNIKRTNISVSGLIAAAKEASSAKQMFVLGEVILGLPGDNPASHRQTTRDLIDDGISKIVHQYLSILPGSEIDSFESRNRFGTKSGYRVMPGAYGRYSWSDRQHQWFEVEERAIGDRGMSFEEYLSCLEFDLTVEVFYNNNLFDEFTGLFNYLGLPLSGFVDEIYALRPAFPPALDKLYNDFVKGRREELDGDPRALVEKKGKIGDLIERLIEHENKISLGVCKAAMIFGNMDSIHAIAYEGAVNYLKRRSMYAGPLAAYLEEASRNSFSRKSDLLKMEDKNEVLHYDFVGLKAHDYRADPSRFALSEGAEFIYRPNMAIIKKYEYLRGLEPDPLLRWRKLLFEPRIDSNDEFCRVSERGRR